MSRAAPHARRRSSSRRSKGAREIEHHARVHLHESPIGIPRERRVPALRREAFHVSSLRPRLRSSPSSQASTPERPTSPTPAEGAGPRRSASRSLPRAGRAPGPPGCEGGPGTDGSRGSAAEVVLIVNPGERGCERRHLRQAGSFSAQHVFHGGGAVGPALTEKPDQWRA